MSIEQIQPLLKREEILVDSEEIRNVLQTSAQEKISIDIYLGRDKRTFTSYFLPYPEEVEATKVPDYLLLAPLEPAAGNIAIRQAEQIKLHFFIDIYSLECLSSFMRVENIGGAHALRMEFPSLLRVSSRRNDSRLGVPKNRNCPIYVSRRNEATIPCDLLDINRNGLGFLCSNLDAGFEKGSIVRVKLVPTDLGLPTFEVMGEICSKTRVRDKEGASLVQDRYGIRLLEGNQFMQVKKLVDKLKQWQ